MPRSPCWRSAIRLRSTVCQGNTICMCRHFPLLSHCPSRERSCRGFGPALNVDLFLHGFEKRRFGHEGLLRRAAKIVSAACTEDRPGRHQYRRVFACIVIVYEADDKKAKWLKQSVRKRCFRLSEKTARWVKSQGKSTKDLDALSNRFDLYEYQLILRTLRGWIF